MLRGEPCRRVASRSVAHESQAQRTSAASAVLLLLLGQNRIVDPSLVDSSQVR